MHATQRSRSLLSCTLGATLALCAVSAPVLADMAQSANVMAQLQPAEHHDGSRKSCTRIW